MSTTTVTKPHTMDIEFSQLRVSGHSFNLVDLAICTSISRMEQMLIAQLDSTVRELESLSKQRIAKIYVGKTYIPRKKASGKRYMPFDCLAPNTWKMTGIRNRWRDHHRQNYGRDGLVVLCAITKETVPNRSQMSQEDLAQAMERRLLDHYLFDHPEKGVVNETFTTGNLSEHNYHAYGVYIAFTYEETSAQNPQKDTRAEDEIEGGSLEKDYSKSDSDKSPASSKREYDSFPRAEDEIEDGSLEKDYSKSNSDQSPASSKQEYDSFPREEDVIENDWLLGLSPPNSNSPPDPTILDSPRPNEVQNQPNDSHSFPREEDEIEGGSLEKDYSKSDSDKSPASSKQEHDSFPRAEDEIENDWLLGLSPPHSNSPPDPTILDSPRPNEVQN